MSILQSHPGEVARALRNHHYEQADGGILLRGSKVFIGGALQVRNYANDSVQSMCVDSNMLVTEGLIHALNNILVPSGGYSQVSQWYFAPYKNDYTPTTDLTAATFASTAGEFTNYTSATRLALTIATAATTTVAGTSADSVIIFNSGGPYSVYGAAIVSASAKSATTGKMLAAIRMDAPMLGMPGGSKLGFSYQLSAADAG